MNPHPAAPAAPAQPPPEEYAAYVGIDWAHKEHVVCVIAGDRLFPERLTQSPETIAAWVAGLQQRFGDRPVAVALEQQRGPLIAALRQYPTLVLFPINPKQLARYREALFPSGSQDDPTDAQLLAQFLKAHHRQLRPWRPDDGHTRHLAHLCELRRKTVDARKKLVQQLTETLQGDFPLALEIAGPLTGEQALALLTRWPTHGQLQRANPETLRRFFREHGLRDAQRLQQLVERIRAAAPLTTDQALVAPAALWVGTLVAQVRVLNASIAGFETELARLFRTHADAALFATLPGAGEALAPRLLVAFGSDRERYASAADVQSYSGIAPVTKRSGKSVHVQRRYACPKFLRQTFHEFANQARQYSRWSRAYYQLQRSRGKKHQAAVRALAYKWIRILFQVWKTRTPYDEQQYQQQLRTHHSPVVPFLEID
jgi:transposase